MTINVYQQGDSVRLSAAFRNTAGDLADPTAVTFWFTPPTGVTVSYAYVTDAEIVRDSIGTYHVDLTLSVPYRWKYQFKGAGNDINMVENGEFDVEPNSFV